MLIINHYLFYNSPTVRLSSFKLCRIKLSKLKAWLHLSIHLTVIVIHKVNFTIVLYFSIKQKEYNLKLKLLLIHYDVKFNLDTFYIHI